VAWVKKWNKGYVQFTCLHVPVPVRTGKRTADFHSIDGFMMTDWTHHGEHFHMTNDE
jgi:hypothetical protein